MMKLACFSLALGSSLILGACSRPAEVREVARLSQPIAAGIQASAGRLQARMALQADALEFYAASLGAAEGRARAHVAIIERDLRLADDETTMRTLTIIREGDAAILADPLSPVAAGVPAARPQRTTVDVSPLSKAIAGLDRLGRERRGDWREFLTFAQEANSELRKIESEGAAETPAPPAAPATPAPAPAGGGN